MLYQLLGLCSICIEYRALMEQYWQGKTEVLVEEPVFVRLCPPQISRELSRD